MALALAACGADRSWPTEAADRAAFERARGTVLPADAEPRFVLVRRDLAPRLLVFDAHGAGAVTDAIDAPADRALALVLHGEDALQVDVPALQIRRYLPADLPGAFGVALPGGAPCELTLRAGDVEWRALLRPRPAERR